MQDFFKIPIDTPYKRALKNYAASLKPDRRCVFRDYGVPDVCGCVTCVDFKKHWLDWVYAKGSYEHPMTLPSLISAMEIGNYGGSREDPVWLVGEYLYSIGKDFVYFTKFTGLWDENKIDSLGVELKKFRDKCEEKEMVY